MNLQLDEFPNSLIESFVVTSPPTGRYNCIAWAYGDNSKGYWPENKPRYFWPDGIPTEENLQAFISLFEGIGYETCENDDLDEGYTKIAIYCDANGNPKHAARQLDNGLWTSKLGDHFDVTHSIFSM